MAETRYAVLGFQHSGREPEFGLTTNPLLYLVRVLCGEYRARAGSAPELRWAISQPSYETAIGLRNQLNELPVSAARTLASDQSISESALDQLRSLAAGARTSYVESGEVHEQAIAQAWALIPTTQFPRVARRREIDLDDPFTPLPARSSAALGTNKEHALAELERTLFIFDLDGTLVDTSDLDGPREQARVTGSWSAVRAAMGDIRAFRSWGAIAPHELPRGFAGSGPSRGSRLACATLVRPRRHGAVWHPG